MKTNKSNPSFLLTDLADDGRQQLHPLSSLHLWLTCTVLLFPSLLCESNSLTSSIYRMGCPWKSGVLEKYSPALWLTRSLRRSWLGWKHAPCFQSQVLSHSDTFSLAHMGTLSRCHLIPWALSTQRKINFSVSSSVSKRKENCPKSRNRQMMWTLWSPEAAALPSTSQSSPWSLPTFALWREFILESSCTRRPSSLEVIITWFPRL